MPVIIGIGNFHSAAAIPRKAGEHHQASVFPFDNLRFAERFIFGISRNGRLGSGRRPGIFSRFVIGTTDISLLRVRIHFYGRNPISVGKNGGTMRGRRFHPAHRFSRFKIFRRILAVGIF